MSKFNYIVYSFTDNDSVPFYIGLTKNMTVRVKDHNYQLNKGNSLPKYNKLRKILKTDSFLIKILDKNLTEEDAKIKEVEYIKYYKEKGIKLHNLTKGGDGGDTISYHPRRKEILEKKSKALKGKPSNKKGIPIKQETKNKIKKNNAKYWLGKRVSEETKDKIREKRKKQDMSYLCKSYSIISPDGKKFIVQDGLEKFCKKHNLQRSKLVLVAQHKRKHHKKWKCAYTGE